MTEKELKRLPLLKRHIEALTEQIAEILQRAASNERLAADYDCYNKAVLDGLPKGTMISDATAKHVQTINELRNFNLDSRAKLEAEVLRLQTEIAEMEGEIKTIEEFIYGVTDEDVREILRLRYVQNLCWGNVGIKVHMTGQGAGKKCYKFLQSVSAVSN